MHSESGLYLPKKCTSYHQRSHWIYSSNAGLLGCFQGNKQMSNGKKIATELTLLTHDFSRCNLISLALEAKDRHRKLWFNHSSLLLLLTNRGLELG